MNVVLIAKQDTNLYQTLAESETARDAIRFYEPVDLIYGVFFRVPTVAGALALTSDIRYYVRRYVDEVLYEFNPPFFCTASLAEGLYLQRTVILKAPWPYRVLYRFSPRGPITKLQIHDATHTVSQGSFIEGLFQAEVWCSCEEYNLINACI